MLGVEVVDVDRDDHDGPVEGNGPHPPDADLAEAIQRECFDRD